VIIIRHIVEILTTYLEWPQQIEPNIFSSKSIRNNVKFYKTKIGITAENYMIAAIYYNNL